MAPREWYVTADGCDVCFVLTAVPPDASQARPLGVSQWGLDQPVTSRDL